MEERSNGLVAFCLVYLTFFLDNVLLTVLVPIIPAWVRGGSLALWAAQPHAPLAAMLNGTVHHAAQPGPGSGASQALVGAVLGAKAAAQLASAPVAAAAVCRAGPAPVLAAATCLLAAAALALAGCGYVGGDGRSGGRAACVGAARAAQGAGAAAAAVAGLALVAVAAPPAARHRALGALLGAVALGVLVGYPFGGAASELWRRSTPFLLLAAALLTDLLLQTRYLDKEEYRQRRACSGGWVVGGWRGGVRAARGAGAACAGAVLLTTAVMAALEPCLPLWIQHTFRPQRWQAGAVFIPDSAGYLVAASTAGALARKLGAERVAIVAVAAVGVAAMTVPLAPKVSWLAVPHLVLGLGLGATDAALVPALAERRARALPHVAALLQAASSIAYTLGPVLGGLAAWRWGFENMMRTLGAANLLYTAVLYRALRRHPLSEQWGAGTPDSDSEEEDIPLAPGHYAELTE
ncbi:hypothetical protein ACJJTC_007315 [Scirpophaga incertulas]